jgi:hypothetical protein
LSNPCSLTVNVNGTTTTWERQQSARRRNAIRPTPSISRCRNNKRCKEKKITKTQNNESKHKEKLSQPLIPKKNFFPWHAIKTVVEDIQDAMMNIRVASKPKIGFDTSNPNVAQK